MDFTIHVAERYCPARAAQLVGRVGAMLRTDPHAQPTTLLSTPEPTDARSGRWRRYSKTSSPPTDWRCPPTNSPPGVTYQTTPSPRFRVVSCSACVPHSQRIEVCIKPGMAPRLGTTASGPRLGSTYTFLGSTRHASDRPPSKAVRTSRRCERFVPIPAQASRTGTEDSLIDTTTTRDQRTTVHEAWIRNTEHG